MVPFPLSPRLALLDWDGTFCDSRKSIYEINVDMASEYGVHMPSFEDWLQASHPGVEACMRHLGVQDTRENINAFFNRLLLSQRERGYQNPLYEGTVEFLDLLKDMGIPAIIISRHLHDHLVHDIEKHGLLPYFAYIMGEPKDQELNKTLAMKKVCASHNVRPSETFYLGDTSHDMRLAYKAGVSGVAVTHVYDPVSELERAHPSRIFGSIREFTDFLRE